MQLEESEEVAVYHKDNAGKVIIQLCVSLMHFGLNLLKIHKNRLI